MNHFDMCGYKKPNSSFIVSRILLSSTKFEYIVDMGGVPSIPTDHTRRLQVIGAGYSRTGTVTMQLALEKLLDGPVLHGGTQILSREDGQYIRQHNT